MQLAEHVARADWKSLSVVGTAKNAGKTTVLNHLYRHLDACGFAMGLMSTGRDGERVDLVTNEPKPPIRLEAGTLVATAHQAAARARARLEVLETLPVPTPQGAVTVGRVREAGTVELVGPGSARAVRGTVAALGEHGARRVLVDGSMDRRRAAAPHITGRVILASGASLAGERQAIIERTALWVEFLGLPPVGESWREELLTAEAGRVILLGGGRLLPLDLTSALAQEETIARRLQPEHTGVVLPGAFTDTLARALLARGRPVGVVVNDATCVFLSRPVYERFYRRGGRVEVLHPIRLLALCLNPVGPQGVTYDPRRFMADMARALPHVTMFDVVSGLYREGETRWQSENS